MHQVVLPVSAQVQVGAIDLEGVSGAGVAAFSTGREERGAEVSIVLPVGPEGKFASFLHFNLPVDRVMCFGNECSFFEGPIIRQLAAA